MTERGQLVVLSGPSGVGKDTVARALAASRREVVISVSATSRAPRAGEAEGVDYHYVSRERFREMIAEGELLEHAVYNGNHYGTIRAQVEAHRAAGRHVILVIEVKGARAIKAKEPDAVLAFLMPPSWETLRQRLTGRGTETAEEVESRLAIAREEISVAEDYDYIIVNDAVEPCVGRLWAVIEATPCRVENQRLFVRGVLEDAQTVHVPDHR